MTTAEPNDDEPRPPVERHVESTDVPADSRRRIVPGASRTSMGCLAWFVAAFVLAYAAAVVLSAFVGGRVVFDARTWVRVGVGTLLVLGVVLAMGPRVLRRVRVAWHRRGGAGGGDTPWRKDYPWRPGPVLRSPTGRAFRSVFPYLGPGLYFFGGIAFSSPSRDPVSWTAAGVVVVIWAWKAHGLLWTGTLRVGFDPLPARPGDTLRVTFGTSERAVPLRSLTLRLRCMTEHRNAMGFGFAERRLQYQETVTISDPDRLPAPGSDIEVDFEIPTDRPTTELARRYPRYWELVVGGSTGEAQYEETFLVPVYAASAVGEGIQLRSDEGAAAPEGPRRDGV